MNTRKLKMNGITMLPTINMKYKLRIVEPWESGTDRFIKAEILKHDKKQFLFVNKIINVRGNDARYFICKLKDEKANDAFNSNVSGMYEISIVFDKSINNAQQELPDIESYRANFLSGELIIS